MSAWNDIVRRLRERKEQIETATRCGTAVSTAPPKTPALASQIAVPESANVEMATSHFDPAEERIEAITDVSTEEIRAIDPEAVIEAAYDEQPTRH